MSKQPGYPLLYSEEMVRALLAKHKFQTRRICKEQRIKRVIDKREFQERWSIAGFQTEHKLNEHEPINDGIVFVELNNGLVTALPCPYWTPEKLLWCRETWKPDEDGDTCCIKYYADGASIHIENTQEAASRWLEVRRPEEQWRNLKPPAWRPNIHMHRWMNRITQPLVDIRLERVQDISEADAIAEGVIMAADEKDMRWNPVQAYEHLWDSLNGDRAIKTIDGYTRCFAWKNNPWVWVLVCGEPIFKNIDTYLREAA